MILDMVTEADIDGIVAPEGYEVLDATALGKRLGIKRDTVLAYLSRRNFRRIGPIWYERSVQEWERKREKKNG
jgi:hypothetical protein